MERKPLIVGSICAVVLLIIASLSNVVGYQSVKSTVSDSPLFQTRTQRATKQQQNVLTSRYLGMGKENLLEFQIQDNKTESFVKAIEYISKMDDKTFEWFTQLCIQRARQDNTYSETNNDIIQMLRLIRKQSKIFIFDFTHINNQVKIITYEQTMCPWWPGCYIFSIVMIVALAIIFILMDFSVLECSYTKNC